MAYVTICDECLARDCDHCGESKLKPELERLREINEGREAEDMILGGGICLCGHGEEESDFAKSVRAKREGSHDI